MCLANFFRAASSSGEVQHCTHNRDRRLSSFCCGAFHGSLDSCFGAVLQDRHAPAAFISIERCLLKEFAYNDALVCVRAAVRLVRCRRSSGLGLETSEMEFILKDLARVLRSMVRIMSDVNIKVGEARFHRESTMRPSLSMKNYWTLSGRDVTIRGVSSWTLGSC